MRYQDLKKELGHKERNVKDLIDYIKLSVKYQPSLATSLDKTPPSYSILLGAGASVTSGIQTGASLVEGWRKEIYLKLSDDLEENYNNQCAIEYLKKEEGNWYNYNNEYSALFEKKFDLPSQRRRFVENEVDSKLPSIGYSYLVSLANKGIFNTFYTTNFDDLINEAFYQFSHVRPILCAHDSSINGIAINTTRPKIIKLHGDYLFDDIKSTLRETESLEINIKDKLIEFCKEFGLVVIGYAGHDRSIMDVLHYLLKSESHLKNGLYWCLREEDEINPELRKLLWKERVYYIKIKGFDELMAEIHHDVVGELALNESFKKTKMDLILEKFSSDEFKLSDSSTNIKHDIGNIKKHKNSVDITNLIRELNSHNSLEDKNSLPENDFRNLLEIDNQIIADKLDSARNMAERFSKDVQDPDILSLYLRRLVKIDMQLKKHLEALKTADQIVKLDPYNINNILYRASIIKSVDDKVSYLLSMRDDFQRSYIWHNKISHELLSIYCSRHSKTNYRLDNIDQDIEKYINISLKLEPSLDNPAWLSMIDLLKEKKKNSLPLKEKDKIKIQIRDLVDKAIEINPDHSRTMYLRTRSVVLDGKYSDAIAVIDDIIKIIPKTSKSKRHKLVNLLVDTLILIGDFKDKTDYERKVNDIINDELLVHYGLLEKPNIYRLRIISLINFEKNILKAKDVMLSALDSLSDNEYAEKITSLACDLEIPTSFIRSYIERIKSDLDTETYNEILSDIYTQEKEYELAIEYLDKALDLGCSYTTYCTKKSFVLLKAERYAEVISFIATTMENIRDNKDNDVLIINRELSKKLSGIKMDEVSIRNVINKANSEEAVLCAHILLDATNSHKLRAEEMLKHYFENDCVSLLMFRQWPAVPRNYLNKHLNALNEHPHSDIETDKIIAIK